MVVGSRAPAGPVNSQGTMAAKIKEIEDAGAALQRGQVDEAYKLLQEAIKKNPGLPPARLMLARLFLATNEGQRQGRATLERAAAENADHPEVFLTIGSLALAEGRFSEALLTYQTALDLSTTDRWTADQKKAIQVQARTGLASAFEARTDWPGARSQLAALLDLDAKNGQLRQRLARALFFLDKPEDAHRELQTAVKDDPTLEPAAVYLAKLWANKGDSKLAREWLDKAIKAEPNSLRVHLAYADWLLQQNEIEQAKLHAEAAAKVRPEDTDVLRLQGLVARIQKDLSAAEKSFRRVFNDSPTDFVAANQLALVLADQPDNEQRKRALQYAEVNVRQFSRSNDFRAAESLATFGYVSYRNGNVDGALQALQMATAGGQATSDTAYYLALVLSSRDKVEEAKKLLKSAVDSKGLFVYRKEAQSLLETLDKKEPVKDKR
jgi:uncharacterized protein (TIGR02996 family)